MRDLRRRADLGVFRDEFGIEHPGHAAGLSTPSDNEHRRLISLVRPAFNDSLIS
jgi:hypothetical protein